MAEIMAFSCDAVTGAKIDQIPVSAFPHSRMLSAGDSGSSVTVALDGTFSKTALRDMLTPWARLIVLERDGTLEYMGYVLGDGYTRGQSALTVPLGDWWTLAARRGAWDHSAPNVEKWKTTVAGNRETQAAAAILRGRSGVAAPPMGFPMTIPGFPGGTSVSRTYYGYHMEYIADVLADLLDEGLDIYHRPRWINNGEADWLMNAGMNWGSGAFREFFVTADKSNVTDFKITTDAARVTNNAHRIGEGSEVDMLVRSNRNFDTPYPLLSRTTQSKNVSNAAQLASLSAQDLIAFATPTTQWEFSVTADTPVDVGDTARLFFDGDPWLADGYYTRRVIGIKGDVGERKTVIVQPSGGA